MNKYWYVIVILFLLFLPVACTPEELEPAAGLSQTTTPAPIPVINTPTLAAAPVRLEMLPTHPDAVPELLPVYLMAQDPFPMNDAIALAWADAFGLENANVAEVTNEIVRVLSRNTAAGTYEELTFINTDYERVIIYSTGIDWQSPNNPTVTPFVDLQELPALSQGDAITAAFNFVQAHDLLAEPLIATELPSPDDFYRVHVSYGLSGFRLTGISEGPGVTLRMDGNGRVVEARIIEASFAEAGSTAVRPLRDIYPAFQQGLESNVYFYERAHRGGAVVENWLRFQGLSLAYGEHGDRAELVYTALPLQPDRLVPMWLITRPHDQSWYHFDEYYLLAAEGENVPRPMPSPTTPALEEPPPTATPSTDPQLPVPTASPVPTMTPATAVPLSIDSFELLEIEELNPGKRLTFEWSTSGAGGVCLISGTARRMGPWWSVPPSGTLTVEVEHTLYRDPEFTLQAYTPGGYCAVPEAPSDVLYYASESIAITWPCELDYFFTPPPRRCPLEPAAPSAAAVQVFENGRMLWLEQQNAIFILTDNGEFRRYDNEWSPGEPEFDPEITPPDGLVQPVHGFGKVWREQAGVRDLLGWGLFPEKGFETIMQYEHHEGSSSGAPMYLKDSGGQVLWLFGVFAGTWGRVGP